MRKFKFVTWCVLILPYLSAQTVVDTTSLKGRVVAAKVEGKVESVDVKTKESKTLKVKDIIREKDAVNVGASSAATLVFSNGATINLGQNTNLVISEFLQNPFESPFGMAVESEESSVSTLKLDLTQGEIVCKVKKLQTDAGSSMTINTPVGAAGIRGTTFAISYIPPANGEGQGTYTLSVTEGSVTYTDQAGQTQILEAGKEIVVTFTSRQDPETGNLIFEIQDIETKDVPPERMTQINDLAESGQADANNVVFKPNIDVLGLENLNAAIGDAANDDLPDVVVPTTDPNPKSNIGNNPP